MVSAEVLLPGILACAVLLPVCPVTRMLVWRLESLRTVFSLAQSGFVVIGGVVGGVEWDGGGHLKICFSGKILPVWRLN